MLALKLRVAVSAFHIAPRVLLVALKPRQQPLRWTLPLGYHSSSAQQQSLRSPRRGGGGGGSGGGGGEGHGGGTRGALSVIPLWAKVVVGTGATLVGLTLGLASLVVILPLGALLVGGAILTRSMLPRMLEGKLAAAARQAGAVQRMHAHAASICDTSPTLQRRFSGGALALGPPTLLQSSVSQASSNFSVSTMTTSLRVVAPLMHERLGGLGLLMMDATVLEAPPAHAGGGRGGGSADGDYYSGGGGSPLEALKRRLQDARQWAASVRDGSSPPDAPPPPVRGGGSDTIDVTEAVLTLNNGVVIDLTDELGGAILGSGGKAGGGGGRGGGGAGGGTVIDVQSRRVD